MGTSPHAHTGRRITQYANAERWNLLAAILSAVALAFPPSAALGSTYYVRATVGDDAHDGRSPETAWQHFSKLAIAMHAGDTAYIGPGLYRDGITLQNSGTPQSRITLIGDTTGQHTGDPRGPVMITGADPIDEAIFVPSGNPGVYEAHSPFPVHGVVEMDGDQYRYVNVTITKEYLVDKISAPDIVTKLASSYFYDPSHQMLYIHTSDGNVPHVHEIELFHRQNGIELIRSQYAVIVGFTFRHFADAGINFFKGSAHGIAFSNTSYGSRQGIRVYGATDILLYGNTLFRNENCGLYLAAQSASGTVIGNVAYENLKGVRWSSDSANGLAIANLLFDNHERGLSIESSKGIIVRSNRMLDNMRSQLLVIPPSEVDSEANCFENGGPQQLTADFSYPDQYSTLTQYQHATRQDMNSQEGACGPTPAKVDVQKLHAETLSYLPRARKLLRPSATTDAEPPARAE